MLAARPDRASATRARCTRPCTCRSKRPPRLTVDGALSPTKEDPRRADEESQLESSRLSTASSGSVSDVLQDIARRSTRFANDDGSTIAYLKRMRELASLDRQALSLNEQSNDDDVGPHPSLDACSDGEIEATRKDRQACRNGFPPVILLHVNSRCDSTHSVGVQGEGDQATGIECQLGKQKGRGPHTVAVGRRCPLSQHRGGGLDRTFHPGEIRRSREGPAGAAQTGTPPQRQRNFLGP